MLALLTVLFLVWNAWWVHERGQFRRKASAASVAALDCASPARAKPRCSDHHHRRRGRRRNLLLGPTYPGIGRLAIKSALLT
jgi:hypothetical protein